MSIFFIPITTLKLPLHALLFLLIITSCEQPVTKQAPPRPNILLINVDDLGWKDTGFMGSAWYETPNIDRLASEGMVFTQAYAGAANCAPSRACLMSGLYPPRHGIYTVANPDRGDPRTRRLVPAENNRVLPDSIYTLAEMLRDNGYVTGTFGKWHLGEDPKTQGFHVNVGGSGMGSPGREGYFSPYKIKNIADTVPGEYLTDRLGAEAVAFIRQFKDTSFFLYLPFYSVHTPIMGKEELMAKYKQKTAPPGQERSDYAAMVTSVDENIGKVLTELETNKIEENTLVVFTSDNGGIRDISTQDPLRAGKGSYYEGGIRVPMVVRWLEKVKGGVEIETPVMQMDLYPTLANIIGAKNKPKQLDGIDFSPILFDGKINERTVFWHFPIYLQAYNPLRDDGRDPLFRTRPGSVIRLGKWKLHEYFEDGGLELYDLQKDIGERKNLVEELPGKTEELKKLLYNWRKDQKALMPPGPNTDYDAEYNSVLIDSLTSR